MSSGRCHDCYVCGKHAPWGNEWMTFGSLLMFENFGIILKICSEDCKSKLAAFGGADEVFESMCNVAGLTSKGKRAKDA